ncbi:MAG TPA: hypothetical protein VHV53_00455 [Solirubrobacterales bacterium]|nr:hypothetical protein [Solirubrobacterales bacterium]
MARALIVGCGCSGRALGAELREEGWAVRGTGREAAGLEPVEAAGIEPARADPDQPGQVLDLVGDVAIVIWLLGSAAGPAENLAAIHGPRLESLLERLVETPVRGFVYEGVGSVDPELLAGGAELARNAERTWRIPVTVTETPRSDGPAWVEEMETAVTELLSRR